MTRSTAWTNTVRNRFRQKAAEIQAFRALEIGAAKWCKEHIPRKGNNLNDITEEGISLLDDAELWWEKQNLLWACHKTSYGHVKTSYGHVTSPAILLARRRT
jgi:hypothetical protein